MGGIDKVWSQLAGRPVIWYAVAELSPLAAVTVLVVRAEQLPRARNTFAACRPELRMVSGGYERQDSVAAGLAALEEVDVVAVHDAARPFATAELLQTGLDALRDCEGALPVQPIRDTIKRVDEQGSVMETVDRRLLRAAQTPQIFLTHALRVAHQLARDSGRVRTDDASLVEEAGFRVKVFPGLPSNLKITTPDDLDLARWLFERRRRS